MKKLLAVALLGVGVYFWKTEPCEEYVYEVSYSKEDGFKCGEVTPIWSYKPKAAA